MGNNNNNNDYTFPVQRLGVHGTSEAPIIPPAFASFHEAQAIRNLERLIL
jgi:hypothetical protein